MKKAITKDTSKRKQGATRSIFAGMPPTKTKHPGVRLSPALQDLLDAQTLPPAA